jgi:hypothetical protein
MVHEAAQPVPLGWLYDSAYQRFCFRSSVMCAV